MSDFDLNAEREEERQEERFRAKLSLEELSRLKLERCCIFLKDFDAQGTGDLVHGRVMGFLAELDSLVLRDLRPGRELLQAKAVIPYANVHRFCVSPSLEKCRGCSERLQMEREALDEQRWQKRHARKSGEQPAQDRKPKEKAHARRK